jgi:hypothetical protein
MAPDAAETGRAGAAAHTAGVVVSLDEKLYFVPAEMAGSIVQRPVVTRVPGTHIGMALIGGRVVTVIDVGPRREELLLCEVEGEPLALSGLSVCGSGFYSLEGDQVRVDDQLVPGFDVKAALLEAELELWAQRRGTRNLRS